MPRPIGGYKLRTLQYYYDCNYYPSPAITLPPLLPHVRPLPTTPTRPTTPPPQCHRRTGTWLMMYRHLVTNVEDVDNQRRLVINTDSINVNKIESVKINVSPTLDWHKNLHLFIVLPYRRCGNNFRELANRHKSKTDHTQITNWLPALWTLMVLPPNELIGITQVGCKVYRNTLM